MAHLIQKVTPQMLSSQPDQTSAILNQIIDAVNELQRQQ